MAFRIALHDRQYELRVFKSRAMFVLAGCVFAILLLISRLIYLQLVQHETFSTLSLNNRLRLMAIAPNRGLIYDRNGIVLADNQPSYRLEITPEEVDDIDLTLSELAEVIRFSEADVERFRKAIKRERQFEGVPLRFNLNDQEVALFAVNRHRFPGVDIAARLSRRYPFAESAVHVLGYVGRIDERDLEKLDDESNYRATSHIGKVGIERYYESELHGTVGYQQVEVNVEGRVLRVLEEQLAVPGNDLYLNLDIALQQVAENALEDYAGAVVAIEPSTGAILAFVSKPTYDPHLFVNGISSKDYTALQKADYRPLFNRALTGQYPPGSTIKPIIGLAALERGVQNTAHRVYCKGYYQLPTDERKYRDWKREGHGTVDLDESIAQSCDIFFYDLAYRMGIDKTAEYLAQFGFGKRTGIDMIGEKKGILPSSAWKRKRFGTVWFPGESLSAGIGQGYMLMTPLQIAHMTAIFAADGHAYKPRLLAKIGSANMLEQQDKPVLTSKVPIRNRMNWEYVHKAMLNVVHGPRGTARSAANGIEYEFAGKTGTAQVISIAQDEEYDAEKIAKRHRDHALFVAYAPAEKPSIALAILVENGGSGGSVAAPIARKIFDHYIKPEANAQ